MSDSLPSGFGPFVPGFDFLQKLGQGGNTGASGLGHWIAPTVDAEELEQRITELKAVQFWLEQNLLALKTTVQALEVQKMTLVALRGMNLSVSEVAKAFAAPAGAGADAASAGDGQAASGWPYAAQAPATEETDENPGDAKPPRRKTPAARKDARSGSKPETAAVPGVADPMQWWGALAEQFRQIAAQSMRQAGDVPPEVAGVPASTAVPAKKTESAHRKKQRAPQTATPKKKIIRRQRAS